MWNSCRGKQLEFVMPLNHRHPELSKLKLLSCDLTHDTTQFEQNENLCSAAFIRLIGKLSGIDKPSQNQAPGVSFSLFGYLVSFKEEAVCRQQLWSCSH